MRAHRMNVPRMGGGPRSMGQSRPMFTITIVGPPGGARLRLLETLRENGYTVGEPQQVSTGSTTWRVEVHAPYGETT